MAKANDPLKAIRESILNVPQLPTLKVNTPFIPPIPPNPVHTRLDADLASAFYERLTDYVVSFEKKLKADEEVGLRLVSFGETVTIHVEDIGYYNPSLICFYGTNEHGKSTQLIQHVSQINFLLTAVPRLDPERKRIGFTLQEKERR